MDIHRHSEVSQGDFGNALFVARQKQASDFERQFDENSIL